MTLTERLVVAQESPLGMLLLALMVFLIGLLGLYGVLSWRQRRRDLLASRHRQYYSDAEELAHDLTFVGSHQADFFGRRTIAQNQEGEFFSCLIPPPDLLGEGMVERYRQFEHAIRHQKLPSMVTPESLSSERVLVVKQKGGMSTQGKRLSSLREVMLDHVFPEAESERILLCVAQGLAALHDLKTVQGELLYHGFLLPSHIFLKRSAGGNVEGIQVGELGLAFALGGKSIRHRLGLLRQGSLLVDRFVGQTLLSQLPLLAPEQKDPRSDDLVGPESDFFSFGALACSLFTGQFFSREQDVDWEKVPAQWRPFIRRCLQSNPHNRPKDFLELEDWLHDPDLLLSPSEDLSSCSVCEEPGESLPDMVDLLDRLRDRMVQTASIGSEAEKYLSQGLRSMRGSHWTKAVESLKKGQKLDPDSEQIRLNLAICYYEMGRFEESEVIYRSLKADAPLEAKRFREHIAFRV